MKKLIILIVLIMCSATKADGIIGLPLAWGGEDYSVEQYYKAASPQTLPSHQHQKCGTADTKRYDEIVSTTLANYILHFGPTKVWNMRPPQICVISLEELNDTKRFTVEKGRVVGRYLRSDGGTIYITQDALKPKNTDLVHELIHHFNYLKGITDKDLDEKMAYEFEAIFGSEY